MSLRQVSEQQHEVTGNDITDAERRIGEMIAEQSELVRACENLTVERTNVLATLEEVRRERAERVAYTERLEQEILRYEEAELSIAERLDAAEKAAKQLRAVAEREASLIVADARVRAREELLMNAAERDRLVDHARTVRTMLTNALFALDERALGDETE